MKYILLVVTVLAVGCTSAGLPFDIPTTTREHFDVFGPDPGVEEIYALFEEVLEVRPKRAVVIVLPNQTDFNAAASPGARGVQGIYVPRSPARILTYVQSDPRVIRHEIAHHFSTTLLGPLPDWLNEGLAEILEGVRRSEGCTVVPILSSEHLDRLLEFGIPHLFKTRGHAGHNHVDYAVAWATVALLLTHEQGSLRERLTALKVYRNIPLEQLLPRTQDLLELARSRITELAENLTDSDPSVRAAAARILGRVQETEALRAALENEKSFPVLLSIAGGLLRNGDISALRTLLPRVHCRHALHEISRSSGLLFETRDALVAWMD